MGCSSSRSYTGVDLSNRNVGVGRKWKDLKRESLTVVTESHSWRGVGYLLFRRTEIEDLEKVAVTWTTSNPVTESGLEEEEKDTLQR